MRVEPKIYVAGAVFDAQNVRFAPGALAVADRQVVAVGEPEDVRRAVGGSCEQVELPDRLLLPGLVNGHAHLQMTSIGPRPYPGSFNQWVIDAIGRWRQIIATHGEQIAVRRSMAEGVSQSIGTGVLRVGDIVSWNRSAAKELRASGLMGTSFIELVGIGGEKLEAAMVRLKQVTAQPPQDLGVKLGLEAHAPYSTGPKAYQAAAEAYRSQGTPLTTHLAEMTEEVEFVRAATGPFREMIEQMGRWEDAFADHYRDGLSPVAWLDRQAGDVPWLCAHCNYVDDDDIQMIADRRWSVAYCPRASEYFGHRGHRYREMLEAGVNVCLGTDSILCTGDLSILNEMRHLYQRDQTDPPTLLAMATTRGMAGLLRECRDATFTIGVRPGIVCIAYDPTDRIDPLTQVLAAADEPRVEVLAAAGW